MSMQKTKLGARFLSDSEMGAILPDWKSIHSQIEVFRHDRSARTSSRQEYEQKTNNIGIMGRRGAGKTSILKSFHKKLKEENPYNDIVLPIIIPENMSSGTALMDVILGMLKPLVDAENKAASQGDCIYLNRSRLEQAYHKLVKQYCYIKKDYRDILIHQFTSEQYYVDKTTEVFSSDTVFIEQFSKFIDMLLDRDREDTSRSMVFLFIDDIDLSTVRCMDVVKTLLSYLSHPRIVTFLSGDLDTFEEALTLEFLRQEKALDANVFMKAFGPVRDGDGGLSGDDDHILLEQKKRLSYEYLKKILPPAYRKNIKYWSLEERGNYRVTDEEGKEQKTLAELLAEVTAGKIEKSCFVTDRRGRKTNGIPLMYHLFDETSRGLNNVYNVLLELCREKKGTDTDQQEDTEKMELWRLLQTVIDSVPFYAKYKETLLKKVMIQTGLGAQVDFLSLKNLLYHEDRLQFSAVEGFRLFLLAEFAAGLFSKESRAEPSYQELKLKILAEYIQNEEIDGKVAARRSLLNLQVADKDKTDGEAKEQWILKRLLQCGSFLFDLNLIQYLGRDIIYDIFKTGKKTSGETKELNRFYKIATALKKTIWTICGEDEMHKQEREKYLAELYLQAEDVLLDLLNHLPYHQNVIYGEWLVRGVKLGGAIYQSDTAYNVAIVYLKEAERLLGKIKGNLLNPQYKVPVQGPRISFAGIWKWVKHINGCSLYGLYFESCLRENDRNSKVDLNIGHMEKELIHAGMAKTLGDLIEDIKDNNQIEELNGSSYGSVQGKEDEKERQVIIELDKAGMWNHSYVKEKVFPYLRKKVSDYILNMCSGRLVFDASQLVKGTYIVLRDCNKGTSRKALVYGLVDRLKKILFLSESDHNPGGPWYMRLEHVLVIRCMLEEFLHNHPRVRYGKQEARQFLMELKELPLVIRDKKWDEILEELETRENKFFYKDELPPSQGNDPQSNELLLQENEPQSVRSWFQEWKKLRYDLTKNDDVIKILREQGKIEELDQVVDQVYRKYYLENGTEFEKSYSMNRYIKNYIENTYHKVVQSFTYIEYLVQKKAVCELKKNLHITPEVLKEEWSEMELIFEKEDYMFYFHSYLRYLLANESWATEVGRDAQEIKTLVDSLLESEVLADRMRQSDVFELASQKLGITEAEFEDLFQSRI